MSFCIIVSRDMKYEKAEKILDNYVATLPKLRVGGALFVFFFDTHLNSKGGHNEFERNLELFIDTMVPYYKDRRVYGFIGGGDLADLWESLWVRIVSHSPNRPVIEFFAKLWCWCNGNHDRKASPALDNRFAGLSFADGVAFVDNQDNLIGFCCHGDVIDVLNRPGPVSAVSRWLVRYIWTPIQKVFNLATRNVSPAEDTKLARYLNGILTAYAFNKRLLVFSGHTHLAMIQIFEEDKKVFGYVNGGSWTGQGGYTIELDNGIPTLRRWDPDGSNSVISDVKEFCFYE